MVHPDIVMVELCKSRTAVLQLDEETILNESKSLDFSRFTIFSLLACSFTHCLLFAILNPYINISVIIFLVSYKTRSSVIQALFLNRVSCWNSQATGMGCYTTL